MLVYISHINYNTKVYFRLWSFGMCPHRTEPWVLRQQLPPKHWYLWARLCYITVLKTEHLTVNLDDWLMVHHSITLVDLQLDAQNSYLFMYNTFIKILYVFRACDCPVHRLTGAQDSHLQTVTIPEAAYIQLWHRPPEDERGNARNM
jgi:hypothetical protein